MVSPIRSIRSTGQQQPRAHVQRGLGMVELLCSMAITGAVLGQALPAFQTVQQRQLLSAQAAALETDVQYARSQARAMNRPVRLTLQATDDGGSCYMVHTGAAAQCRCDAAGRASCDVGARLFQVSSQALSSGVSLGRTGRSVVFDAGKGTVTPTATFVLANREGQIVHQIVNIVGRTRSCTPNATPGYPACR